MDEIFEEAADTVGVSKFLKPIASYALCSTRLTWFYFLQFSSKMNLWKQYANLVAQKTNHFFMKYECDVSCFFKPNLTPSILGGTLSLGESPGTRCGGRDEEIC